MTDMATETGHPGYIADKDDLAKRLKRIEGQVRGIERMVADERYCIDILTQISAVQAGLDKVGLRLLSEHAAHCVIGPDDPNVRAEKTSEMMAAVARLMGRG
jgi:DNA-binding FrmR family transcriptional regulator